MSEHAHPSYVKIWAILVGLLVVSVLGPLLEIQTLTLLTAFGIAFVKAYIVIRYFMHLNLEARYVSYFVGTAVVFLLLFFFAVAPDVMQDSGTNWTKPAWIAEVTVAATGAHDHAHH